MYWMLFMTILSAFHVIHAWREQIKLLKGLLNFFVEMSMSSTL